MPAEGRGLSSRQTQDVVRDPEIGQPSNSETCSETADGVTRKSEGGGRLPHLGAYPCIGQQPVAGHRREVNSCLVLRRSAREASGAFWVRQLRRVREHSRVRQYVLPS